MQVTHSKTEAAFLLTSPSSLLQCPPCSPSTTSPAVQPPLPGDHLAMALNIRFGGKRPADFHVVRTVQCLTPTAR
jgi:predicted metal-binding protein